MGASQLLPEAFVCLPKLHALKWREELYPFFVYPKKTVVHNDPQASIPLWYHPMVIVVGRVGVGLVCKGAASKSLFGKK
jgi:hypothetical protein